MAFQLALPILRTHHLTSKSCFEIQVKLLDGTFLALKATQTAVDSLTLSDISQYTIQGSQANQKAQDNLLLTF